MYKQALNDNSEYLNLRRNLNDEFLNIANEEDIINIAEELITNNIKLQQKKGDKNN